MDKIAEQYVEMGRLMAIGFQQQMMEDGILSKEAGIISSAKGILVGGRKAAKDVAEKAVEASKDVAEVAGDAASRNKETIKEVAESAARGMSEGVASARQKGRGALSSAAKVVRENPGKAIAGTAVAGGTAGLGAGYVAGKD